MIPFADINSITPEAIVMGSMMVQVIALAAFAYRLGLRNAKLEAENRDYRTKLIAAAALIEHLSKQAPNKDWRP